MHSRVMLPAWLTRYGEWLFDLLICPPPTISSDPFQFRQPLASCFQVTVGAMVFMLNYMFIFMLLFSRLIRPRCRGYLATIFLQRYSANTDSFIAQKFRTVGKHCWKINVRVIFQIVLSRHNQHRKMLGFTNLLKGNMGLFYWPINLARLFINPE